MNAPVIPISSRRPPVATTPAPTTPTPQAAPAAAPRSGIGRGETLPPSVIELGAARRYIMGFYTRPQFVDICGSEDRALAAWAAYERARPRGAS